MAQEQVVSDIVELLVKGFSHQRVLNDICDRHAISLATYGRYLDRANAIIRELTSIDRELLFKTYIERYEDIYHREYNLAKHAVKVLVKEFTRNAQSRDLSVLRHRLSGHITNCLECLFQKEEMLGLHSANTVVSGGGVLSLSNGEVTNELDYNKLTMKEKLRLIELLDKMSVSVSPVTGDPSKFAKRGEVKTDVLDTKIIGMDKFGLN